MGLTPPGEVIVFSYVEDENKFLVHFCYVVASFKEKEEEDFCFLVLPLFGTSKDYYFNFIVSQSRSSPCYSYI